MGVFSRRLTVLIGAVGATTLVLAGCSSAGNSAAGETSTTAAPTTIAAPPGLDKTAQATLNDPAIAWDSLTDSCRTEVSSHDGGKDAFETLLEWAAPFEIVSANEASGEVVTRAVEGAERAEIFLKEGDAWRLTCDGDLLAAVLVAFTPAETETAQPAPVQPEPVSGPQSSQGNGRAPVEQEYSDYGQPVQRIDGVAGVDTNGDGVLSGFERCGVGCGDAPTSGEIQLKHGCEDGYIDDPELCAQVYW